MLFDVIMGVLLMYLILVLVSPVEYCSHMILVNNVYIDNQQGGQDTQQKKRGDYQYY